jgi:hypothetical protein
MCADRQAGWTGQGGAAQSERTKKRSSKKQEEEVQIIGNIIDVACAV